MNGQTDMQALYRAETADDRIVSALDSMSVIYQRRSGITHIVSDPVPQILAAMGDVPMNAAQIAEKMALHFDLGDEQEAQSIIAARLAELAELGLVERANA